jgi:hypothetical protein
LELRLNKAYTSFRLNNKETKNVINMPKKSYFSISSARSTLAQETSVNAALYLQHYFTITDQIPWIWPLQSLIFH